MDTIRFQSAAGRGRGSRSRAPINSLMVPFFERLSIARKLPAATGALVLAASLLVTWEAYREVERTALQTGRERLQSAAAEFAQLLRNSRTSMITAARSVAR